MSSLKIPDKELEFTIYRSDVVLMCLSEVFEEKNISETSKIRGRNQLLLSRCKLGQVVQSFIRLTRKISEQPLQIFSPVTIFI